MGTTATRDLYRVIKRHTSSLQPSTSFWNTEVLYCGYDREEARRVYHENEPSDSQHFNYGSPWTETKVEVIKDGGTEDFSGDEVSDE